MIGRRRASKYTQNVESLQQSSFTSLKGIDCNKAPTNNDTVLNVKNLDVDYDGGLVLRKPITYSDTYPGVNIMVLYDGSTLYFGEDGQIPRSYYLKITDIYGKTHTFTDLGNESYKFDEILFENVKDLKYVNTSSSTIFLQKKLNLDNVEDYLNTTSETAIVDFTYELYNSTVESNTQPRMYKFYYDESLNSDVLEIITPEPNVIYSNDISLDFNTTLQNPITVRDNYYAAQTSIKGVLAYSLPTVADTHISIVDLTESGNYAMSDNSGAYTVLKAFLDKPNVPTTSNLRIRWEKSTDGIEWTPAPYLNSNLQYSKVAVYDLVHNDIDDKSSIKWSVEDWYYLRNTNYKDSITTSIRDCPDCLILDNAIENRDTVYRCVIISVKKSTESPYYDDENFPALNDTNKTKIPYIKDFELSSLTYYLVKKPPEALAPTFKNPITGNMIYWNHALYSISPEFKNNVYVSNPDSAIFPVSRIIDLGTYQGTTISKLIPWRDYLVAFTENSVHLITEQEVGFTTKTVNTFIGVPERDANTCVSILNGIIFKSGNKLYTLIPNYNSGDESILNISDISKPIEHILENLTYNEECKPFAFTTSESYYLFVPDAVDTKCLKYNYSRKIWTFYTYPRVFYDYKIMSVDDIRLFSKVDGVIYEYYFEKEPSDIIDLQMYGDYIDLKKDSDNAYKVVPIEFFVDSGQKTDNIVLTKQFVESKIIVATLSDKDNFQMDVNIAVEGNTFKKHIDLNTDGALLRNDPDQLLTLGSSADSANSDTFNTIRQMFIRYSGKGKTIRHIISGTSLYKFKIYETLYRYKILNVKQ